MKKRFKRFCDRCEKLYQPTSKYQKICENCKIQSNKIVCRGNKKIKKPLIIECPNCSTKFDTSQIREDLISKIYLNLKNILKI